MFHSCSHSPKGSMGSLSIGIGVFQNMREFYTSIAIIGTTGTIIRTIPRKNSVVYFSNDYNVRLYFSVFMERITETG